MIQIPAITTFTIYFIFLMTIGVYFYRKTSNVEDYILGGRGLGKWVTAISAQASDMSGWLLMGLPGAVYLSGISETWIAIGLFIGTVLNWKLISVRLRIYTMKTDSLTLSTFFEDRFKDPTGLLRTITAIITLLFFTVYISSGLVAAGKLFESMFSFDYSFSVLIGAFVIILYTLLGGFMAVSWTDLFQGSLMFLAITIVPLIALNDMGGIECISRSIDSGAIRLNFVTGGWMSIPVIISTMAWGLGYFGQPHILARFMGIKKVEELPKSMAIAVSWVAISLTGAILIGLVSIPMFQGLPDGDHEKVFIFMITKTFNPWVGGIMLAAIMSAIMSTIDSQLLVASSALAEDLYLEVMERTRRKPDEKHFSDHKELPVSQKNIVLISRLSVILISIVALIIALQKNNTVLGLVAFAWAGFGAAFGPLVLFSLYSRKTSWQSALAGMTAGTITLIIWKVSGLNSHMYEIVPGFIVNIFVMMVYNKLRPQSDRKIEDQFDDVLSESK